MKKPTPRRFAFAVLLLALPLAGCCGDYKAYNRGDRVRYELYRPMLEKHLTTCQHGIEPIEAEGALLSLDTWKLKVEEGESGD